MTKVKTAEEIAAMRRGGQMLGQVLAYLRSETQIGRTPQDMSRLAQKKLNTLGGEPAFKGFHGYPDIICISVNNQVQHSIPTDQPFEAGDVVNYDFGVRYKGLVTDGGITVGVGKLDPRAARLLEGTEKALAAGIAAVHDGCRVGDISAAIEAVLKRYRLGIVRELVGHGVGHELHETPNIPNYGMAGKGPVLRSGMTIAIEPITTLGREDILMDVDGWTLWTSDGSFSAQFEHTILISDDGAEILTQA